MLCPRYSSCISSLDRLAHKLCHFFVLAGLRRSSDLLAQLVLEENAGFFHQVVGGLAIRHVNIDFERNQSCKEPLLLPNHHNIRTCPTLLFEYVFDRNRCDILSPRCNNQFFDASRDRKEIIFAYFGSISTMDKPITIYCFTGGLCVLEITRHYVTATHAQFSFSFVVFVNNLHFCTR